MPSLCGLNRALGHKSSWTGRSDQAFSCFLNVAVTGAPRSGWRLGLRCRSGGPAVRSLDRRRPGLVASDRVAGRFGAVEAAGGRLPVDSRRGGLFHLPSGILLEAVMVPALRAAITFARSAACLVGGVVLEITLGSGPAAGRGGAGGVPDLGEVTEQDAGVVAPGLVPVIALAGRDRADGDYQVPLPRDAGGQPPGAVAARRAMVACGGEGEPLPVRAAAGRVVSAGRARTLLVRSAFSVAFGCWPSAAVADGVAVLVRDRDAPRGRGVPGGGAGQVAGQPRVDGTQRRRPRRAGRPARARSPAGR